MRRTNIGCQIVILALMAVAAPALAQIRDRNATGNSSPAEFQNQGADARWQNPGNNWRPPTYQLGVQVRNTERGVVLTNVVANSPAQRAGLERNDTILTVNGYQVGYVGRQLYDLGDEVNARASDGRVLMLIQNSRNGELRNITVDLGSSRSSVTGTIRWGTDVSLSRNAMLVVRIMDVTNPAWRDVVIVEQIVRGVSRGSSPYEIAYTPSSIRPNRRYAISAHVRDGEAVLFETTTPKNITLSGGGQRLDFTLDRVRGQGGNRPGSFPTVQIVDLYQALLGRPPTAREIAIWQAEFARGATLDDVRRQLLGGSEYYDRSRNNDDRFLNDAYSSTQGRAPSQAEIDKMRQQLQSSGGLRTDFVRDLMKRLDENNAPPK